MAISISADIPGKLSGLARDISMNCDISDARFWGYFSMCGFLLRLRSLYKFEHGIEPWKSVGFKEIGPWIEKKQSLWETLEEKGINNISIGNADFDAYDITSMNKAVGSHGLVYSAGLGLFTKPVFCLATLKEQKSIDSLDVYVTGREHVRDMSIHPAMLRDNTVFVRSEIIELLIWDRLEDFSNKKGPGPVHFAFRAYGIPEGSKPSEGLDPQIRRISDIEADVILRHEIGEAYESRRLGSGYAKLIAELKPGKALFVLRSLKDILADTDEKGMLGYIISQRNEGSLGFYIAGLSGFQHNFSRPLKEAFQGFTVSRDWRLIEEQRLSLFERADSRMSEILGMFEDSGFTVTAGLENMILTLQA